MPNTTSHYFSFTVASHSSAATAARARLNNVQTTEHQSATSLDQTSTIDAKQRQDLGRQALITYYGATLTVWTCAEPERARQLADIRKQLKKKGELDSVLRAPISEPLDETENGPTRKKKQNIPWMPYRDGATTDFADSDTETVRSGLSEARRPAWMAFGQEPLGFQGRNGQSTRGMSKGTVESSDIGIGPLKAGEGDTFWMPYALTLGQLAVSRG